MRGLFCCPASATEAIATATAKPSIAHRLIFIRQPCSLELNDVQRVRFSGRGANNGPQFTWRQVPTSSFLLSPPCVTWTPLTLSSSMSKPRVLTRGAMPCGAMRLLVSRIYRVRDSDDWPTRSRRNLLIPEICVDQRQHTVHVTAVRQKRM